MKKALLTLVLGLVISSPASAETWIARCNGLQLNFDRSAKTVLLFLSTNAGLLQIAQGDLSFDNGTALRGGMTGNAPGFGGQPLTELGVNKSRNSVYVQHRHPSTGDLKTGEFCTTTIEVRP